MRDNINNLNTSVKAFLMSMSLESLRELHSFVHTESLQNESSELNTYDVKKAVKEDSDDEYEELEEYEEPEESKYYSPKGLSQLNEESGYGFELKLEKEYYGNKFDQSTPKPSKESWYDDYERGLYNFHTDSKISNPYYDMQDTSPYYSRRANYPHYTMSSNTTTVLSGLVNKFSTPYKARSENTISTPPSASSLRSTGTTGTTGSAETFSTTAGYDTDKDEQPFVEISSSKSSNGTVNMVFSRVRLRTAFANQEDHNTAYEMFIRFCITQCVGYKIRDIPYVLSAAFSGVMTEYNVTDEIKSKLESLQQDKNNYSTIKDVKLRDYALRGVRESKIETVVQFVESLARNYSSQESVVHFKTGNKGATEGSDVAAALASLKILDEFNDLKSKLETSDDKKILFAKQCLAVNGRLVRGMQKIYGMPIADIRKKFKLDTNVREDDNGFDIQKATELLNYLDNKSRDYNFIGGLIENCFDFPRTQYKSKGRKNAIKVELEDLESAASVAVIMTSGSFLHVDINNSIPSFLSQVSGNQGWRLSKNKIGKLTTSIQGILDDWNNNKEKVLYSNSITKMAEVTPAHTCLDNGKIIKKRKNATKDNTIQDNTTKESSNVKKSRRASLNDILSLKMPDDQVSSHTYRYQTRSKTPMSLRK